MINLSVGTNNQFAIYADTLDNSIQDYGDYFLIVFKSLYTNHLSYVVPQILNRNSRFVKFNIEVVEYQSPDDPLNGILEVFPPGNYSYKVLNTNFPTLDPSAGLLIDEGQMVMANYTPPEVVQYTYISDNETFQNIIYYSGFANDCIIDFNNSIYYINEDMTSLCQPLIISDNGGFAIIEDGFTWSLN
jgi:hypothetical protein